MRVMVIPFYLDLKLICAILENVQVHNIEWSSDSFTVWYN